MKGASGHSRRSDAWPGAFGGGLGLGDDPGSWGQRRARSSRASWGRWQGKAGEAEADDGPRWLAKAVVEW